MSESIRLGGKVQLAVVGPYLYLRSTATSATAHSLYSGYHIPIFAFVNGVFGQVSECIRHIGLRIAHVVECIALNATLLFRCQRAALRVVGVGLKHIAQGVRNRRQAEIP